jgi:hypothetical protein
MVYFIQAGKGGPVKIGSAINVHSRLRTLQCAHYEKLAIIKVIPGKAKRERQIHKDLSAFKIRGEWFEFARDVEEYIGRLEDYEYVVIDCRAYAVLKRDTESSPTDPCPFCGRNHIHGAGDGHRVAHCISSEAREKVQVEGVALWKMNGYYLKTRW